MSSPVETPQSDASPMPVSVERDGRVFTGAGVTEDSLHEAIDQTTLGRKEAESVDGATRNPDGTFTGEATQTPKPSRGQRRFDTLTKEREDAKRDASEKAARIADLERQLATRTTTPAATEAPAPSTQPPATTPSAASAPADPKLEDFLNDPDPYAALIKATAKWEAGQVEARWHQRLEAERATRAFSDRVATTRDDGRAAYPDFEAVMAKADDVQFPAETLQVILATPNSHVIQYALAKDKAQAQRIASLPLTDPMTLMFELGQIAARSSGRDARPASSSSPVPMTHAPEPYQPVGARGRTVPPSLDEAAASGSMDAYRAARGLKTPARARG